MLKPLLAITMGDPAGIGPETIVGAWSSPRVHRWCRPLVVGHPEVIEAANRLLGNRLQLVEIDSPEEALPSPGVIPCLRSGSDAATNVQPGEMSAAAGQAAYDACVLAADLALSGRVDAITTAPLCKQSLHMAGKKKWPGHTELLADLCGVPEVAMMLYLAPDKDIRAPAGLGVVHVTLHSALRDVFAQLNEGAILSKARLAAEVFGRLLKDRKPRIGVCALNPHAGEGGLFGEEERTIIRPAVERGLAEGLNLVGPLPTDTLMVSARDGHYDAVVAMYHDQGHIALKLLGFHRAVNITLGLPIVRTSVAHGTAFDLAWQGRAQPSSMIEAVRVAGLLARERAGGIADLRDTAEPEHGELAQETPI